MTTDPFSQSEYLPQAPRHSRTWLYVAVILGIVFLFVSLLLVASSLLVLNHVGVIGNPDVPATDGIASDVDRFVSGLGQATIAHGQDAEIRQWLESYANEPNGYIEPELPFDKKLFMQAVAQSSHATSIGLDARFTMVAWLDEYVPQPETLDNYSVISIERLTDQASNEPSDFAVANLYFYNGHGDLSASQGISSRWYLHKSSSGWQLYDAQQLEFGRRTSDEWANYLSNLYSPHAEGYDNSKSELAGVAFNDDPKAAIKKEEQRQVLPRDQSSKQLLIAQAYYHIAEYDDALRMLNGINDPEVRWGVLSLKSFVLTGMQRYDESIAVADELLTVAPNHPNGLYAMCNALSAAERLDMLRTYLLRLLDVCPAGSHAMSRLTEIATPADLPELISRKLKGPEPNAAIEDLLSSCFQVENDFPRFLKGWREHSNQLTDVPNSFWKIVEAAEALDSGDTIAAAQMLQRTSADHPDSGASKFLEEMVNDAFSDAFHWCDSAAMAESDRLYSSCASPSLLTRFVAIQNKLRLGTSLDESLTSLITTMDSEAEHELEQWSYYDYFLADQVLVSLLQYGYLDEVEKLIACVAKYDDWQETRDVATPRAGLLLYRNDIDSLTEELRGWESEDVTEWLSSEFVGAYLLANPATAERLLAEFTPDNPSEYFSVVANTMIVVNDSQTRPSESAIRSWVESAIKKPFQLSQVNTKTRDEANGLGTWKVKVENGLELLVTISEAKFDENYLESDEVLKALKLSNYVVVIESVAITSFAKEAQREDPFEVQRFVWEIARQSLSDTSLGVYCGRTGSFWLCNQTSRESLHWGDGIPGRDETIHSVYLELLDDEADVDEVSSAIFTEAIENGRTAVRLSVDATCATEMLDAELLSVDEETVQVRLKQDCQLFPLYKTGQTVSVSMYSVELVD